MNTEELKSLAAMSLHEKKILHKIAKLVLKRGLPGLFSSLEEKQAYAAAKAYDIVRSARLYAEEARAEHELKQKSQPAPLLLTHDKG